VKQLDLLLGVQDLDLLDRARDLQEFEDISYSAHPNPHLEEFVQLHRTDTEIDEIKAFPSNIVAGKNTYAYDAHTYHTKVPPQAIVRLIEHYAEPGGIVLDPFCGSGMTGLAALRTRRKPVLVDLSPAATFIALNFLTPVDVKKYSKAFQDILSFTQDEEMHLYGTHCRTCGELVPMKYMVWSYGLICKYCHREFILWDVARDEHEDVRKSKIKGEFDCPHCGEHLKKRYLKRTRLYPVQVGYRCCGSGRRESKAPPDDYDMQLLETIEREGIPEGLWYPTAEFQPGVNTRQPMKHGLESVDDLYTTRQLRVMANLWDIARRWKDKDVSLKLMYTVTSLYKRVTRLSEFRFWGGSGNIANYNVPMIFNEQNIFQVFDRKAKSIRSYFATWETKPNIPFCISTQSATRLDIPADQVDYIFTDPPFGSNINYSEMNYLWESWLGVFTKPQKEAIVNRAQKKSLDDYQDLMTQAFREMHRVLKPERWLTVMFHNSSAKVWAAIQESLSSAGFEIDSIQTLNKRHGTFKQFVSANAVGYNLLLHCQKRNQIPKRLNHNHESKDLQADIEDFVTCAFEQNPENFVVQYLHVDRDDEIDSRKLYSLWLKEQMESHEVVNVSYEDFRRIATEVIDSLSNEDTTNMEE